MREVEIKRIYDEPARGDGYRVLIDRLWPRGITKERAHLNEWAKDIAPSTELREWFSHDPARMSEFRTRYLHELHAVQSDLPHRRSPNRLLRRSQEARV